MKGAVSTLVAFCAMFCGAQAFAQDGTAAARLRLWRADLGGDLSAKDAGTGGSAIDVDSTLGITDSTNLVEFNAFFKIPVIGRFELDYWTGKFDGSQNLSQAFTYAGSTYNAGTTVDAELDFKVTSLIYRFGFSTPSVAGNSYGAGIQLGVKLFDIQASIDGLGVSETVKFGGPVPAVGAFVHGSFMGSIYVEAQAHGLHVSNISGVTGTLVDFTITVDYKFSYFFAGLGYRLFKISVEDKSGTTVDEAKVDINVKGLFIEFGAGF